MMKTFLFAGVTLLLAALPSHPLFASSPSHSFETITLANGEWPPYQSQHLKHYGVASHIATEAFKAMGIKVEYSFLPWARAFVYSQQGRMHGTLVFTRTPEREKSFYYSDPIFYSQVVFFHRTDAPLQWRSVGDLRELQIGVTVGSNYGEEFNQALHNGELNVQKVNRDELNFYKLLAGRIDIFPINLDVGLAMTEKFLTTQERNRLTYHPQPVYSSSLHLILGKTRAENARLIQIFNQGLHSLQNDGRYDHYISQSRAGLYKQEPLAEAP